MTRTQGFACVAGVAALAGMTIVATMNRPVLSVRIQPPPIEAEAIRNGSFELVTDEPPGAAAVDLGQVPFGRTVEVPPLSATIYQLTRR